MSLPDLEYRTDPVRESDADLLLVALPPLEAEASPDLSDWPGLRDALLAVGFTGAPGAWVRVYAPEATSLPLAVVGTGTDPDAAALRDAVGAAIRALTGFATVAVAAPFADPALWTAAAEGAALGGYRFDGYKTEAPKPRAARVIVHGTADADDAALKLIAETAASVALVKDLVNIPAEWLGPADVAERAVESVAGLPVSVEILDEEALREQGFGGILGVGQGSDRPPRLVRLEYAPEGATRHIALVGKGITFDTGGLSLKPAASMVGMKYDMAGAATVLAVLRAAASVGAPVKVTAWLCLADNMPSGRATRPGDVLRLLDGTTVEVLNTDAEGRLVLADGLAAASREHPDVIVDVATLTGAILIALGTRHTGVMGDDAAVAALPRRRRRGWRARVAAAPPRPHGRGARLPHRRPAERQDRRPCRRLALRRTVPASLRRPHGRRRRCAPHPVGASRHRRKRHPQGRAVRLHRQGTDCRDRAQPDPLRPD